MNHFHSAKIIAFVGLPGSGKSTAVNFFTEKGFPKVYFGGVILQAMKDANLEINPENEKKFREEFRLKNGKEAVAREVIKQIQNLMAAGQHRIIADGLYSWTEYKELKHTFPGELTVVAILAPKQLRYQRLAHRPERPMTEHQVTERDWKEIENLEKGGPIAIADYFILNDKDEAALKKSLTDLANELQF